MCCKIERNGYMSGKIEFLYLNEEDMISAGVLDAGRCIETMKDTLSLFGKNDF